MRQILFILILLSPISAMASDCTSHPMFIHELSVESCEEISESNATSISTGATPMIVAARYPGLIIKGTQRAIRQIDFERRFRVFPWKRSEEQRTYLFQSKQKSSCDDFPIGKSAIFASFTDCECDTGPRADGYCALTVGVLTEVPEQYLKFSRNDPNSKEEWDQGIATVKIDGHVFNLRNKQLVKERGNE